MQPHMSGNPRLVYAWLTMKREMGELELIERIRSGWGAAGRGAGGAVGRGAGGAAGCGSRSLPRNLALGIGDDCAILRPPRGHELLVTTDFTLEGRHFRRDLHPPESVGHRTLARGLSDLAAMGARPLAAFLSLALPTEMLSTRAGRVWVERFFAGLRSLADRHAVPLAGGDTAESPSDLVLADIVLIGSAPAGRALRRSGARAGDALYVTGELGGAAAELAAMDRRAATNPAHPYKDLGAPSIPRSLRNGWESTPNQLAAHPHLFPQPRTAVGLALLRRRLATACIDLSDGLSTDLAHLCRESGVGARISSAALPIHPLAQQTRAAQSGQAHAATNRALDLALHGGEDYELLFAAPPSVRLPRRLAGVRVTRIGSLVRGRSISLLDPTGRRTPLQPGGWEHFTGKHED
jgi:thiamine-monophosphate kinase